MTKVARPISVIICAYTEARWDDLLAAVESVRRQTLPPDEIIVVIDHNPALLARARSMIGGAQVIANSEARGLSGARNTGLSVARGAIIAFMDEDAVAAEDWLATLDTHYAEPEVVGAGGAIKAAWAHGRPSWFPEEFDWVVGCTYTGMPVAPAPVRNLIGCNMSFRREVFARAGSFKDGIGRIGTLPVGCEETELCIRLAQIWPQSVLRYDPQARVRHTVPAARARWGYFRSRCYNEGRSKALVAKLVGSRDGLATERSYTLRTLPLGVARGIGDALRGDGAGLLRAGAIIAGLIVTTAGYGVGQVESLLEARRAPVTIATAPEPASDTGSR
ncbi:glycosyltransferase [Oscillochloris sp. ZM17-4]|uniref:glycosyltransferase family 2 protein n=1 Tax=Oscillochloris sp. ZM17-4 TaxID=2866714 RepID=UPI001C72AE57|nr:glycosyltransferase [Oscillochloris sp. ZM17-4]